MVMKSPMHAPIVSILYGLLLCLSAATLPRVNAAVEAEDPDYYRLTITDLDGAIHVYTTAELLARQDLETVTIKDVSAYPRKAMTYKAVKFAYLLDDVAVDPGATVEFIARDGFTSPLGPQQLSNTSADAAIAYLAIEEPDHRWPLHRDEGTAGPFYLFWVHPELSDIGREEWPYKFNKVVIQENIKQRYAAIVPDADAAGSVSRGFQVYVKNCIACHRLNRTGPGTMGPDLNYPMSPMEYFRDDMLRRFIRDPQAVRLNPGTPMGGFPESILSDQELDDLLAYLQYMADRD
jgi:mono/diheme cytochrome c family protein